MVVKMRRNFVFLLIGCILVYFVFILHYHIDFHLSSHHIQPPANDSLAAIQQIFKPELDVKVTQKYADLPANKSMTFGKFLTLLSKVVKPPTNSAVNSANFITCGWIEGVGLGNYMFQLASLIGLARQLNLEPIIIASEFVLLEEVFNLRIRKLNNKISWTDIGEKCIGCYDPKEYLKLQRDKSWRLTGYLQNYRYFEDVTNEVISHFAFKNETVVEATLRKAKILDEFCPNRTFSNCVLIGVHIRRGDYLKRFAYGYFVADESYILRAVQWYQHNFANFTRVFVVLGNDFDWNSRTFTRLINDSFVVLKPTTAGGDLCLLSLTNHTIMTVGTYGFWAAYLTGGNVTYLKNFSREGSAAAAEIQNFSFPPEWIGL